MIISLLLTIFTIVQLNCENLFDIIDDPAKADEQFTPSGLYRWTPARYWNKINHIGQEILSCSGQAGAESVSYSIPDLVALCEVENDSVLSDLTQRSMLRNAKYEYVCTDSPDERGIDVALLYSPFTFGYIDSYAIRVEPVKDMKPTRDILYVKGRTASGDTLNVFVVHAPSRSGGEYETRPNRLAVTKKLAQSVDSIRAVNANAHVIVAGDFNDTADGPSMKVLYESSLVDVSRHATGSNGAKGTYKYRGEWESIDHILVSQSLSKGAECWIHDAPFLLSKDEEYGGVCPFRNFERMKWRNGFADHLPLIMRLKLPEIAF